MSLKKELISCYGIVRLIDNYIDTDYLSVEVRVLLDTLRGHLSDTIKIQEVDIEFEEQ
jgi:hypothetical protein